MMSENSFKNSYVCPECYCSDGWNVIDKKQLQKEFAPEIAKQEYLECQHCHVWVPLVNVLEYNKENSGWCRLD